ncbi:MAG: hypothetical protein EBS05_05875 [Proteobacteria bacterium]|nr:hypothetical protein [Pseudomonadota bacterium]
MVEVSGFVRVAQLLFASASCFKLAMQEFLCAVERAGFALGKAIIKKRTAQADDATNPTFDALRRW